MPNTLPPDPCSLDRPGTEPKQLQFEIHHIDLTAEYPLSSFDVPSGRPQVEVTLLGFTSFRTRRWCERPDRWVFGHAGSYLTVMKPVNGRQNHHATLYCMGNETREIEEIPVTRLDIPVMLTGIPPNFAIEIPTSTYLDSHGIPVPTMHVFSDPWSTDELEIASSTHRTTLLMEENTDEDGRTAFYELTRNLRTVRRVRVVRITARLRHLEPEEEEQLDHTYNLLRQLIREEPATWLDVHIKLPNPTMLEGKLRKGILATDYIDLNGEGTPEFLWGFQVENSLFLVRGPRGAGDTPVELLCRQSEPDDLEDEDEPRPDRRRRTTVPSTRLLDV